MAIEQDGIDVNFVDFTDIKAVEAALKPNTKVSHIFYQISIKKSPIFYKIIFEF